MIGFGFRWLLLLGLALQAMGGAAPLDSGDEVSEEVDLTQTLESALKTLDQFMVAGKEGEARRGARLLDMYETSPKKAEREIGEFFKGKRSVFSEYVSIANDIYGYEYVEKGYRGPNLELEGGIETADGFGAEFSARLVYRDLRWRILSLEID